MSAPKKPASRKKAESKPASTTETPPEAPQSPPAAVAADSDSRVAQLENQVSELIGLIKSQNQVFTASLEANKPKPERFLKVRNRSRLPFGAGLKTPDRDKPYRIILQPGQSTDVPEKFRNHEQLEHAFDRGIIEFVHPDGTVEKPKPKPVSHDIPPYDPKAYNRMSAMSDNGDYGEYQPPNWHGEDELFKNDKRVLRVRLPRFRTPRPPGPGAIPPIVED